MPGPIEVWFAADHDRLDQLLQRALAEPSRVASEPYEEFREGLLRHIGMEEKILLPAAKEARGGDPVPMARKLRIDHGAIASLLVPSPTPEIVAELRSILEPHNAIEEGSEGLYALCDRLLGDEAAAGIVERAKAYPKVRVAGHYDGPRACRTAAEALANSAKQFEKAG